MVVVNGKRFGYLSVRNNNDNVYIENIQISPSLQGCGIGTDILRGLINKHKNYSIRLVTFSDNPARHLYKRLGFIITDRDGETIEMTRFPNHV
jgi:ribosomal protein S18 acetylase RimI-like enzyme